MADTIEDMVEVMEQKNNKIEFLENKLRLPDSKVYEELNRIGLNKISSKKNVIGLWIQKKFAQ